jgi:hypothetical protein
VIGRYRSKLQACQCRAGRLMKSKNFFTIFHHLSSYE